MREMERAKFDPRNIMTLQPRAAKGLEKLWDKEDTEKKFKFDRLKAERFHQWLERQVQRYDPAVIVVNDAGILWPMTGDEAQTLNTHRGFVYRYHGRPVIIVDDIAKTYVEELSTSMTQSLWIFRQDVAKIVRFATGKQRRNPAFDYTEVKTLEQVIPACKALADVDAIGVDTETSAGWISALTLGGINRSGKYVSFTFCFAINEDPGHNWNADDETWIWEQLQAYVFSRTDTQFIFHNGTTYDIMYFHRYGVTFKSALADTMHMWHAIWAQLPKSLAFCVSIMVDDASFWKDEVKEDLDETQAKYAIPLTDTGLASYYQYNALDVYYMVMLYLHLSKIIVQPKFDWAIKNYATEMRIAMGPALMMATIGIKIDNDERIRQLNAQGEDAMEALGLLWEMCGENFNPKSPQQMRWLMYDVLGDARPSKRGPQSTDAKVLERMAENSAMHRYMVDRVQAYTKPANNYSKYGPDLILGEGSRMHYTLSIASTWTMRFGGKANAFGQGTNPQNIPPKMRPMFHADEGYVFWDADYGQSDLWFVAYETQDQVLIDRLNSGLDIHACHVEDLLGVPYEKTVTWRKMGKDTKEYDFIENKITGVRQIIKKVVHGTNYVMGPATMYSNIGRPSLVAAAIAAGHHNAPGWGNEELVAYCAELQKRYFQRYATLYRARQKAVLECQKNGLKATCFGDRTHQFFSDPGKDHKTFRELMSFYGQGGTAMNINRAMLELYWESRVFDMGALLYLQVHDNLLFGIPLSRLSLADNCAAIMGAQLSHKGRQFKVPIEAEWSFSWSSKHTAKWTPGEDVASLKAKIAKLKEQTYGSVA